MHTVSIDLPQAPARAFRGAGDTLWLGYDDGRLFAVTPRHRHVVTLSAPVMDITADNAGAWVRLRTPDDGDAPPTAMRVERAGPDGLQVVHSVPNAGRAVRLPAGVAVFSTAVPGFHWFAADGHTPVFVSAPVRSGVLKNATGACTGGFFLAVQHRELDVYRLVNGTPTFELRVAPERWAPMPRNGPITGAFVLDAAVVVGTTGQPTVIDTRALPGAIVRAEACWTELGVPKTHLSGIVGARGSAVLSARRAGFRWANAETGALHSETPCPGATTAAHEDGAHVWCASYGPDGRVWTRFDCTDLAAPIAQLQFACGAPPTCPEHPAYS